MAGGFGALARFVVDGLVRTQLGRSFPWGTLIINVSGSLLLGIIAALAWSGHISGDAALVIGVGFCGGYTTFSTASFETVRLLEERRIFAAVFQTLGNAGFAVLAIAVGLLLF